MLWDGSISILNCSRYERPIRAFSIGSVLIRFHFRSTKTGQRLGIISKLAQETADQYGEILFGHIYCVLLYLVRILCLAPMAFVRG